MGHSRPSHSALKSSNVRWSPKADIWQRTHVSIWLVVYESALWTPWSVRKVTLILVLPRFMFPTFKERRLRKRMMAMVYPTKAHPLALLALSRAAQRVGRKYQDPKLVQEATRAEQQTLRDLQDPQPRQQNPQNPNEPPAP